MQRAYVDTPTLSDKKYFVTAHDTTPMRPGMRPSILRRIVSRRTYYTPSAAESLAKQNNSTTEKQFYVTTPIFYVNAAPHVGHLHSMVLADTIKRWSQFQLNKPGFFSTGTDEHGMKVQQAATKAGKDPREFVDLASQTFKQLATAAKISHDRFIRTTDEDNVDAAKELWKLVEQNGFIYKGQHSGWYCVSDETFYPENQVHEVEGQMISKETGKTVEWTSEENYFFALSKLRDPLLKYIRDNKDFIQPEAKWHDIEREVDLGLPDLSISRPKSRNAWGVEVPGDDSQVMYVWFDALANYLAAAGFPWTTKQEFESSCFPPNVQVLGKDIVRFHAIYWPAFLIAAQLPLPNQLVVHAHWTSDGNKMSKSLGNVVDPMYTIDMFGADAVKFYLMNDGYIDHDTVYGDDRVLARHNSDIVNKYGNLVMRVCGHKFNIRRALELRDTAKHVAEISQELVPRRECLISDIDTLVDRMDHHMSQFQPARALAEVWSLISFTNRYIQDAAPWALKSDPLQQDAIIRDAAEVARVCSIALQPFIPEISAKVLDRLAVDETNRTRESARYNKDSTYGVGANRKGDYPVQVIS